MSARTPRDLQANHCHVQIERPQRGLSGRSELLLCAQAKFGVVQMLAQKIIASNRSFPVGLMDVLGCSFLSLGKSRFVTKRDLNFNGIH